MKFSGISISVKNLEESIEYYIKVLGFKYFDTIKVGLGRQAILNSDNIRISLFESDKLPDGKIIDFSMMSRNIDQEFEILKEKGAIVDAEPMQVSIAKIARLKDPDGVTISVMQWNDALEEEKITESTIENAKEWASKI